MLLRVIGLSGFVFSLTVNAHAVTGDECFEQFKGMTGDKDRLRSICYHRKNTAEVVECLTPLVELGSTDDFITGCLTKEWRDFQGCVIRLATKGQAPKYADGCDTEDDNASRAAFENCITELGRYVGDASVFAKGCGSNGRLEFKRCIKGYAPNLKPAELEAKIPGCILKATPKGQSPSRKGSSK